MSVKGTATGRVPALLGQLMHQFEVHLWLLGLLRIVSRVADDVLDRSLVVLNGDAHGSCCVLDDHGRVAPARLRVRERLVQILALVLVVLRAKIHHDFRLIVATRKSRRVLRLNHHLRMLVALQDLVEDIALANVRDLHGHRPRHCSLRLWQRLDLEPGVLHRSQEVRLLAVLHVCSAPRVLGLILTVTIVAVIRHASEVPSGHGLVLLLIL